MKNHKHNRCISVILALMLAATLILTAGATRTVGDVNGDGKVSVFDAQLLLEATAGLRVLTEEQTAAAGELTAQDLVDLILTSVTDPETPEDTVTTVYLSAAGSDSNNGTQDAPYQTLEKALTEVPDHGTVVLLDTIALSSEYRWAEHGKSITITGGTLDFSANTKDIHLKDDLRFEDIELIFEQDGVVYADGHTLYIAETVTTNSNVSLYGGKNNETISGTNMTVLGGNYKEICSGGYKGVITGDMHLTVGGNTTVSNGIYGGCNAGTVESDIYLTVSGNAAANAIYGGGKKDTINGNIHLTVDGNVNADIPFESNSLDRNIWGGSSQGTITGNITMTVGGNVKAGNFYGGSRQGTITGNIDMTVGGSVNQGLDIANHSLTYNIYGGSYQSSIDGSVSVTVNDDVRACTVYGGSFGGTETNHVDSPISGGTTLTMNGGKVMSLFGAGRRTAQGSDVTLTFTGGETEQIFGGADRATVTGDVDVTLSGGKITRRVYGGCYNDTSLLSFATDHYVTGNVTLTIYGDTRITLDAIDPTASSKYNDLSIYARSRHNKRSNAEIATIVFADQAAYDAYNALLGAQDSIMKLLMGNISAADTIVPPAA